MKFIRLLICCLALAAAGVACAQTDAAPDAAPSNAIPQLQQAQTLIEQGKSEEAYALLAPLESTMAGDARYDYLLGISALNSNKASQAVFAFERVQAIDPQYKDIGLWLSIAYYQSGDKARAKAGFEAVLQHGGSADTREKAKRYLDSLAREEAGEHGQPAMLGHLDVGVGHDSNITNTSLGYLSATQLAAAVPAPSSNQGGMEGILNLAVEGRVPIAGNYVFASVEDRRHNYSGNGFMNSDLLAAAGGVNVQRDGDDYKFSVSQRRFRQEGTLFVAGGISNDYDITGGEVTTRQKLSESSYLGFVAQYNQIRFVSFALENTNQEMAGVNYTHTFQTRGKPLVYLGYAYLYNQALQTMPSLNPEYNEGITVASRMTQFISTYLQYSIASEVDIVSTDYIYFRRDLGAYARDPTVSFGRDRTRYVSLGVNWRFSRRWSLRSQLAETTNQSNIPIYSYSKTEVFAVLRRQFD